MLTYLECMFHYFFITCLIQHSQNVCALLSKKSRPPFIISHLIILPSLVWSNIWNLHAKLWCCGGGGWTFVVDYSSFIRILLHLVFSVAPSAKYNISFLLSCFGLFFCNNTKYAAIKLWKFWVRERERENSNMFLLLRSFTDLLTHLSTFSGWEGERIVMCTLRGKVSRSQLKSVSISLPVGIFPFSGCLPLFENESTHALSPWSKLFYLYFSDVGLV